MGNTGVGVSANKIDKWKGWGEKRYMARERREKKTREAANPAALGRE